MLTVPLNPPPTAPASALPRGRRNPYSQRLKKQVTIRLDVDTIEYFRAQATRTGIPYQTLINRYLADCAQHERELAMTWA